ncbi:MAG: glycosyltransferase [Nitrospirales bacterium]|nr:glycosyltransferase [Nitrospira sp.]MDR4502369.1 glycosyltransferase [Nitrospirales bacterium]
MKILLLGLPALKDGFRELGHEVLTCPTDNTGDIQVPEWPISIDRLWHCLPKRWDPDLVLLTDESTHPLFFGLERLEVPLGWYAIDSHIHHRWHQAYAAAFDAIFVAQRDFIPSYMRDESRQTVRWLPLFAPIIPAVDEDNPRVHDLSFVGSMNPAHNPTRCQFLRMLQAAFPLHVSTGDYCSVFTRSKMILNQCVNNDMNFRTFEAMACGGLLLMERVGNGLEELFQDKTHCAMYEKGNIDEVIQIAEYYASHREEREAIAERGRSEVREKHTAVHRAQSILDSFEAMDAQYILRQRRDRQGEILFLLASIYEYCASCYDGISQWPQDNPSRSRRYVEVGKRYRELSHQIHHEIGV